MTLRLFISTFKDKS